MYSSLYQQYKMNRIDMLLPFSEVWLSGGGEQESDSCSEKW